MLSIRCIMDCSKLCIIEHHRRAAGCTRGDAVLNRWQLVQSVCRAVSNTFVSFVVDCRLLTFSCSRFRHTFMLHVFPESAIPYIHLRSQAFRFRLMMMY